MTLEGLAKGPKGKDTANYLKLKELTIDITLSVMKWWLEPYLKLVLLKRISV